MTVSQVFGKGLVGACLVGLERSPATITTVGGIYLSRPNAVEAQALVLRLTAHRKMLW